MIKSVNSPTVVPSYDSIGSLPIEDMKRSLLYLYLRQKTALSRLMSSLPPGVQPSYCDALLLKIH